VITDRTLSVLREHRLVGFDVQPVAIRYVKGATKLDRLLKLWEFVVTGTGGYADKASGIEKLWQCDACGLVQYSAFKHGLIVNKETYDGSDFFAVTEYPKYILVSRRARSVIEEARITSVRFVDSAQLEWPSGVSRPR
jgi:hypothetical protein